MTLFWRWDCWSLTVLLEGWTWELVIQFIMCAVQHFFYHLLELSTLWVFSVNFSSNKGKKNKKEKLQWNNSNFCLGRAWNNMLSFILPGSREKQKPLHSQFCLLILWMQFVISSTSIWWGDVCRPLSSSNWLRKSRRICKTFVLQIQQEDRVLTYSERKQRKTREE